MVSFRIIFDYIRIEHTDNFKKLIEELIIIVNYTRLCI